MKYLELLKETNEEVSERYELVRQRVEEIAKDAKTAGEATEFFEKTAKHLVVLYTVADASLNGELATMKADEGQRLNEKLVSDICGSNYDTSYANPTYAVSVLGKDAGQMLSALYTEIRNCVDAAFEGNLLKLCIYSELFVEIFNYFEEEEVDQELVKSAIYSFHHDYTEVFNEEYVARLVNPDYDYYMDILMEADLSTPSYLYRYGRFIGGNELESVRFLNSLSEEEIKAMASTYTEGYRIGFEVTNKDIRKKKTVNIRYHVGFERVVRCAIENFRKIFVIQHSLGLIIVGHMVGDYAAS